MTCDDFHYSFEQWEEIASAVAEMRRVDDADEIGKGGASLRTLIEIEARMHIERSAPRSALNRLKANRQARIDRLIALRENAKSLRDSIATKGGVFPSADASMIDATDAYIAKLARLIDLARTPISIMPPRNEPTSNASKTNRQQLWTELLAIWREIGGKETGVDVVRFLIAASTPAMLSVSKVDIPTERSISQWLNRRRRRLLHSRGDFQASNVAHAPRKK